LLAAKEVRSRHKVGEKTAKSFDISFYVCNFAPCDEKARITLK
jgi:hypothetical protein